MYEFFDKAIWLAEQAGIKGNALLAFGILIGLLCILYAFRKQIVKLFDKIREDRYKKDKARVQAEMSRLIEDREYISAKLKEIIDNVLGVKRVLILRVSNSGGVMECRHDLEVKAIYEEYDRTIGKSVLRSFNMLVDECLTEVIIKVLRGNSFQSKVEDMGMCMFRKKLTDMKKRYFELDLIQVAPDKKAIYMLMIATTDDKEEFIDPMQRVTINESLTAIKNKFDEKVKYD